MMLPAIVQFFKFKVISSIILFSSNSSHIDRIRFIRQLSLHGMSATFSCDAKILENMDKHRFQGVLFISQADNNFLIKVKPECFSNWYKWLVIGNQIPDIFHQVRYDADVALLQLGRNDHSADDEKQALFSSLQRVYFQDVYVHPSEGASLHPWAYWSETSGFQLTHEKDRIARRLNLKQYSLKIASPVGDYSRDWYNGTFKQYLQDDSMPERGSGGVRSGYGAASLIIQAVNASEVLVATRLWISPTDNSSTLSMVEQGSAQLAGAILRILPERVLILDYVMAIWPFRVGFTYLAERESSSNMYVEPFSPGVWWAVFGIAVILALAMKVTARKPEEKESALITVLATWLQQDASPVPEGPSGRWSFTVLSICSMLVHAYYTSSIVSALMSGGRSGPNNLRALGDSKYAIASENYDYMRYLFFEVDSKWDDLEYLKKKKMTSKIYQDIEKGVEMIRDGSAAYHTEYNKIYPHFKTFSDDQLCKLQYVDTIPESLTWITSPKNSEWTDVLRARGTWLHEIGLAKRLVSRLKIRPPPCRSSLLAERVKLGDVSSLLGLTLLGVLLALVVLGFEVLIAKVKVKKERIGSNGDDNEAVMGQVNIEYIE